jgi:diguanylate cyclase (GGDEF)-like protein
VATDLLRIETENLSATAHSAQRLAIMALAVLALGTLVGSLTLRWSGQALERLRASERESRVQIRVANRRLVETNARLETANERLTESVRLDELTGLLSRAAFLAELGGAIAIARPTGAALAVLFVDLDRFKTFNDTRGHLAGDELLCSMADRLATGLGKSDGAARLGGDEFALFVHAADRPAARARAEGIVASLAEALPVSGNALQATASVGVSLFPDDGDTPERLIQHADLALYDAKHRGGDTHSYFTSAMAESAQEQIALEGALRWAVELGEFEVHYQPIVRVDDGRICGVEALVRWRHPELGLVPPGVFIPVAEDTGIIIPLGAQVMRLALEQTRRWRDIGITELRTAINLSPRELRAGLADQVLAVLSDLELEPAVLSIEITEAWALGDAAMALGELNRLRDAGVTIALDDFGLEHSSLSRIKQLPLDILKIDREFVQEITSDGESAAVVEAAISLGHALHMQVVAEGVETEAQLNQLAALGCDLAQGFLLSRPEPAEALTPLLQAGSVVIPPRAA